MMSIARAHLASSNWMLHEMDLSSIYKNNQRGKEICKQAVDLWNAPSRRIHACISSCARMEPVNNLQGDYRLLAGRFSVLMEM